MSETSPRDVGGALSPGIAALAPFRSRSFRFQWPADLCTAWALEMETLILGWYVLVETGSVTLLTVFGALQYVGTLISPFIGTMADRLGLRTVLAAMRTAYAVFALVILTLVLTGHINPYAVLAVSALSGLIKPTDIGLRSALVGATVPPAHFAAAMGISRTTMDSAKACGALAGAGFMAMFGMGPAYMAITLIYIAGVLLTLKTDGGAGRPLPAAPGESRSPASSPWLDLKEGMAYVWRTPRLLAAMGLAALVNLTAYPFSHGLMPYIARNVFDLDQRGLGFMVASFACGSLIGSLTVSVLGPRLRPARSMLIACVVWFIALLGFALSTHVALALILLVCAGIAQSMSMLTLSILLLRTSERRFHGRIMGVRMLAIYTLPMGLLIAGALIPRIGYQGTSVSLVLAGLMLTVILAVTWRRDLLPRDAVGNSR
jgi:Na+/melibiose symporter-like transporter